MIGSFTLSIASHVNNNNNNEPHNMSIMQCDTWVFWNENEPHHHHPKQCTSSKLLGSKILQINKISLNIEKIKKENNSCYLKKNLYFCQNVYTILTWDIPLGKGGNETSILLNLKTRKLTHPFSLFLFLRQYLCNL